MAEPNWDEDSEFMGELDEEGEDDMDGALVDGRASGDDDDDDDLDDAFDDDEMLDDEFPVGEGVADLSGMVSCPYCGETVEITLDPGSGTNQQYIEDCQVCCRPWMVSVSYDEDGTAHVFVDASDDHESDD